MINKEKELNELSEIILDGQCSYGDIQLYMEANKLDELLVTDGDKQLVICRDKINKLCVKIYDEDEGTCDLMGLDMWMAINKQNKQVDNEVGYVEFKKFNDNNGFGFFTTHLKPYVPNPKRKIIEGYKTSLYEKAFEELVKEGLFGKCSTIYDIEFTEGTFNKILDKVHNMRKM